MNQYVADTHALYWYLTDSPKLGASARRAFDEADDGAALVHVSVISLAELCFLNEKLGQPLAFTETAERLRASAQFVIVPLTFDDVLALGQDAAVPEMHDRIIAAVARRLNAPCLTRDEQIVRSGSVQCIW